MTISAEQQQGLELWLRHREGERLAAEEEAQLLKLLRDDAGFAARCLADADIDALLRQEHRPADANFVQGVMQTVRSEADGACFAARVRRRIEKGGEHPRPAIRFAWLLAAAAALVLGVGVWWANVTPTLSAPDAPVVADESDLPHLDGKAVEVGHLLQIATERVLVWNDDSRLWLHPGTHLRIGDSGDGKTLHLEAGCITVAAASQPAERPMRIHCGVDTAEVVGTRFTLDFAHGVTRLRVDEGTVCLQREERSVLVTAGQRGESDADDGPRLVPVPLWEWNPRLADPHLRYGERRQAADGRPYLEGMPLPSILGGSPKVSGVHWRWPMDRVPVVFDEDLELVCTVWFGESVVWSNLFLQSEGDATHPTSRGEIDMSLAPGRWQRLHLPLRDCLGKPGIPILGPGDPLDVVLLQVKPATANIRVDQIEIRPIGPVSP